MVLLDRVRVLVRCNFDAWGSLLHRLRRAQQSLYWALEAYPALKVQSLLVVLNHERHALKRLEYLFLRAARRRGRPNLARRASRFFFAAVIHERIKRRPQRYQPTPNTHKGDSHGSNIFTTFKEAIHNGIAAILKFTSKYKSIVRQKLTKNALNSCRGKALDREVKLSD